MQHPEASDILFRFQGSGVSQLLQKLLRLIQCFLLLRRDVTRSRLQFSTIRSPGDGDVIRTDLLTSPPRDSSSPHAEFTARPSSVLELIES